MSDIKCHKCGSENDISQLFCGKCNSIQFPLQLNHFQRFNIAPQYDISKYELEDQYLRMQNILHPDKFVTKSVLEKNLALQHTILLNDAYLVLKSDLKRSEYLLKMNNLIVNHHHKNEVKVGSDILMEILEKREELEELKGDKILLELRNLKHKKNIIIKKLAELFNQNKLSEICQQTIRLKFYIKLIEDIELRLN